jgi:hypothetical protein
LYPAFNTIEIIEGGAMKRVTALIVIFMFAALISQSTAPSSGLDSIGTGFNLRDYASTDMNMKNIENKLADSLHKLSLGTSNEKNNLGAMASRAGFPMAQLNATPPNISSLNNSSLNSSLNNSFLNNATFNDFSAINESAKNPSLNDKSISNEKSPKSILSGNQVASHEIGSSSSGKFKGFYGIEASRHEAGKSDINSKMLLSGGFEVDKTVQFQDHGF